MQQETLIVLGCRVSEILNLIWRIETCDVHMQYYIDTGVNVVQTCLLYFRRFIKCQNAIILDQAITVAHICSRVN